MLNKVDKSSGLFIGAAVGFFRDRRDPHHLRAPVLRRELDEARARPQELSRRLAKAGDAEAQKVMVGRAILRSRGLLVFATRSRRARSRPTPSAMAGAA